jgi:hypothetical protein
MNRSIQTYCLIGHHHRCGLRNICTCPCHTGHTPPTEIVMPETIPCGYCDQTFDNERAVRTHTSRKHQDERDAEHNPEHNPERPTAAITELVHTLDLVAKRLTAI